MAELKTRPTKASVQAFIKGLPDETRRRDAQTVLKMMKEATQASPEMWGPSIVGFGRQPLRYASGRELEWPVISFSPRKSNVTLYLGRPALQGKLIAKLGKYSVGGGCLHIKRLAEVDQKVLKELIAESVALTKGLKPRS